VYISLYFFFPSLASFSSSMPFGRRKKILDHRLSRVSNVSMSWLVKCNFVILFVHWRHWGLIAVQLLLLFYFLWFFQFFPRALDLKRSQWKPSDIGLPTYATRISCNHFVCNIYFIFPFFSGFIFFFVNIFLGVPLSQHWKIKVTGTALD